MKRSILFAIPILTFACGAPADSSDSSGDPADPTSVAEAATHPAYVRTPVGFYHKDCTPEIEDGAFLGEDGRVTRADGTEYVVAECTHPSFPLKTADNNGVEPTTNGWVEYSLFESAKPIRQMASQFTVPAAPTKGGSKVTVFLFPGMEPLDGSVILQPVIQYGPSAAGGGEYWAIASWHCTTKKCPHSTLKKVNAGDEISGTILGSSCSGGACTWETVTWDTTTGAKSSLKTTGDNRQYVQANGAALEAYGVTTCEDYPNVKSVEMQTSFYDMKLGYLTPTWSNVVTGTSPSCAFGVSTSGEFSTLKWDP